MMDTAKFRASFNFGPCVGLNPVVVASLFSKN